MNLYLSKMNAFVISDKGFFGSQIIRPNDPRIKENDLEGLRSIIENVWSNGGVGKFNILKHKLNHTLEMNVIIIRAVFELSTLLHSSLRKNN
jgi:hypothetical protein